MFKVLRGPYFLIFFCFTVCVHLYTCFFEFKQSGNIINTAVCGWDAATVYFYWHDDVSNDDVQKVIL